MREEGGKRRNRKKEEFMRPLEDEADETEEEKAGDESLVLSLSICLSPFCLSSLLLCFSCLVLSSGKEEAEDCGKGEPQPGKRKEGISSTRTSDRGSSETAAEEEGRSREASETREPGPRSTSSFLPNELQRRRDVSLRHMMRKGCNLTLTTSRGPQPKKGISMKSVT